MDVRTPTPTHPYVPTPAHTLITQAPRDRILRITLLQPRGNTGPEDTKNSKETCMAFLTMPAFAMSGPSLDRPSPFLRALSPQTPCAWPAARKLHRSRVVRRPVALGTCRCLRPESSGIPGGHQAQPEHRSLKFIPLLVAPAAQLPHVTEQQFMALARKRRRRGDLQCR